MTTTQSHQTPAPTFDDVWRTIQALAVQHQETDQAIRELVQQSKETDRKFQETDRKFQELAEQSKKQSEETDRKFQETDRKFKETDRLVREISKQLGAQGNRLGDFVQEMVRPAVLRLFRSRNLPVHQVFPNVTALDDAGQFAMEIDLLVINTDTAIAVECKSHLSQDDVNEHLERMENFKQYFPQYKQCKLLGAVAAMVLPTEVGRYAYRKGLYVLAQSGDSIEMRNDSAFVPKEW